MKVQRLDESGSPVVSHLAKETELMPSESIVVNGYNVDIFPDKTRSIQLENLKAVFRSPTVKESLNAIKNGKNSSSHQDRLLAISACIKWGDEAKLTLGKLSDLRAKECNAISQLLAAFFVEESVDNQEGENYEITLTFSDFSCTFRDAKATDIDFIQDSFTKFSTVQDGKQIPSLESFVKIIQRLCIRWGDRDRVEESEVLNLPVNYLITIGRVITESFL